MSFEITFENKKYDYEAFMLHMSFILQLEYLDKTTYSADKKKNILLAVLIDDEYRGVSFRETFNGNLLHLKDDDKIIIRSFGCLENMKAYFATFHGYHKATIIMTRF